MPWASAHICNCKENKMTESHTHGDYTNPRPIYQGPTGNAPPVGPCGCPIGMTGPVGPAGATPQ